MELNVNDVVKIRKGSYGVVTGFNGKPAAILFASFTSVVGRYNDKLKHKNPSYDIVAVYNGEKLASFKEVYKTKFNPEEAGLEVKYAE